jgi:hypothetical protein
VTSEVIAATSAWVWRDSHDGEDAGDPTEQRADRGADQTDVGGEPRGEPGRRLGLQPGQVGADQPLVHGLAQLGLHPVDRPVAELDQLRIARRRDGHHSGHGERDRQQAPLGRKPAAPEPQQGRPLRRGRGSLKHGRRTNTQCAGRQSGIAVSSVQPGR